MLSSRRIAQTPAVQKAIGVIAAEYLRLVWWTNRLVLEPADFYERVAPELPVIVGFWHGQHFMTPFLRRGHKVKVLISRHRDGEINAAAARRLGVDPIRGSGDTESDALAMPMTVISSVILTFTSVPSRVLMLIVLPSTFSMVPRMRVGVGDCCAQALDASTDTTASRAASERGSHEEIFGMVYPSRFRSN